MLEMILQGMVVGIANIIQGVSGGTMMVAMGLYDKLIHSITHLKSEFKESMKLCRVNYVTLRVARKLIAGQNAAEAAGEVEYTIAFDKEEFSCFCKLAAE